jgi:hypothetical protein
VADVASLIKRLEWCEEDCEPIIEALAKGGDVTALEPLSAKLSDPSLAPVAAAAMATIATRTDTGPRAVKLLQRGLREADPSARPAIEASIAGIKR